MNKEENKKKRSDIFCFFVFFKISKKKRTHALNIIIFVCFGSVASLTPLLWLHCFSHSFASLASSPKQGMHCTAKANRRGKFSHCKKREKRNEFSDETTEPSQILLFIINPPFWLPQKIEVKE
uniref:Transmembrane protein n=1 Tax=Lacunastrum gracillimum TaxID=427913 RepID=A0A2U8GH92_9CHLO|nr:hypothetical protein [Lacunastrum gracillimum]AWI68063.1 hypothetical protein [Lacunastrum gracillimum]